MSRPGIGAYIGVGIVQHGGGSSYTYETDADGSFIDLYIPMLEDSDNIQSERELTTFASVSTVQDDVANAVGGTRTVSGSIKFRGTYQSLQDWLTLLTGHVVTPTISGNYKIYSLDPQAPSASSHYLTGSTKRHLVIEMHRNDNSVAAGRSTYYQGCLITEATISAEAGGALELEISFIGRKHTVAASSIDLTSAQPTFQSELVKMGTGQDCTGANAAFRIDVTNEDGSTAVVYTADTWSMTIRNPYEHNFGLTDTAACQMPTVSGIQEVEVSADIIAPTSDSTFMAIVDDPVGNRIRVLDVQVRDEQFVSPAQPSIFRAFLWNFTPEPPLESRVEGPGLLKVRLAGKARANSALAGGAAGRNAFRFLVANHNAIGTHYAITPRT